ncbi:MAG TPA: hypothetical protein VNT75_29100, partial [Symbiobacteriaceae bacterium]|nr:hypothetical protein [Symbiobacteriaceae bacterium]
MRSSWAIFVATFLLAASGLGFEIAVTSIFAVVLQYHFVFLAVSVGLMGFGLGAMLARVWRGLSVAGLAGAAAVLMAVVALVLARFPGADRLPLYLVLLILPFTCLGAALALLYAQYPGRSGLLYGMDLSGAALGALFALTALNRAGGVSAALAVAVLPALAAVAIGERKWLAGLVLAGATALTAFTPDLNLAAYRNPPPDKTMIHALQAGARLEATRWDAFARTDLVTDPADPDRKMLFTDGGAGSYMFRWDGSPAGLAPFREQLEYIPFTVGAHKKVLIIGPGGGLDILLGLAAGAEAITAVEINQGLIDLVRENRAYNGGLLDKVKVVVADGRKFVADTTETYDLILLNLVYTQAAEARSAALTENYIFTTEAFSRYYDLLSAQGSLAVVSHSGIEASRALLTGVGALPLTPPEVLQRSALLMTQADDPTLRRSLYLLRRRPFDSNETAVLMERAQILGLQPLHVPGRAEVALKPLASGKQDLQAFLKGSEYNLSPTRDDRPFFFQLDHGLPAALQQVLIVSLLLFGFVTWLVWGVRSKARTGPGSFYGYFALLGLAFMLVEIPLIQRAMLVLGSPQVSMALVVTLLLLGGGAGAILGGKFDVARYAPLAAALAVVAAALAPGAGALIVAPLLGLALGIPFPHGIRLAGEHRPKDIPLLYAVNGT